MRHKGTTYSDCKEVFYQYLIFAFSFPFIFLIRRRKRKDISFSLLIFAVVMNSSFANSTFAANQGNEKMKRQGKMPACHRVKSYNLYFLPCKLVNWPL